jgi:DNA-binding XRE family transcriptional regulator
VKQLNEAAKHARIVRKWTEQKAADRAGIDRSTLVSIERGKIPSLRTAYKLADAYGLSVYDIFLPEYVAKCNAERK